MDISKLKTDSSLEEDGVWVPLGDARIKVARMGNKRYQAAFNRRMTPHKNAARAGIVSDDVVEGILIEVIAETVLRDWEGIDDEGVPVPYSRENAVRILTDIKAFRDIVVSIADRMETFRRETIETSEKN
ncbi:hypothetical protein [Azospirillum brasilense]|uniref:hypothetical protein n=1 Tax=Azospirillum brasilense TaxID=192 RepID=UPI000E683363|nr:hypothetical protein [Azospirillum brasilense]NUB24710.1 hypothetical protein [Azospirillum brasilense]NUB30687.1 hypothetical protein [Azospirillum brasilense]RIW08296.1 hypothetical protein D2T81_00865 [Azospirillum brasilense]